MSEFAHQSLMITPSCMGGTSGAKSEQEIIDELKKHFDALCYRVVVKVDTPENKTAGGIYLTGDTLEKEHSATCTGVIIAMGPSVYKRPEVMDRAEDPLKVGDRVFFSRYCGRPMRFRDTSNPDKHSNTILLRLLTDEDLDLRHKPTDNSFLELLEVR